MNELISGKVLAHIVIVAFGALVRALIAHQDKETRTWFGSFTVFATASLTGVLFGLLALQMFPDQIYMGLACTAVGTQMGESGLAFVTKKVKQILS